MTNGLTPESKLTIRRIPRDEISMSVPIIIDDDLRRILSSLRKNLAQKPPEEFKKTVLQMLDKVIA